jgi:hypothetical protein
MNQLTNFSGTWQGEAALFALCFSLFGSKPIKQPWFFSPCHGCSNPWSSGYYSIHPIASGLSKFTFENQSHTA